MICPKCNIAFNFRTFHKSPDLPDRHDEELYYVVSVDYCPECDQMVVILSHQDDGGIDVIEPRIIFPEFNGVIANDHYVPSDYLADYNEALFVSKSSGKASAALARRLLRKLFKMNIKLLKAIYLKKLILLKIQQSSLSI